MKQTISIGLATLLLANCVTTPPPDQLSTKELIKQVKHERNAQPACIQRQCSMEGNRLSCSDWEGEGATGDAFHTSVTAKQCLAQREAWLARLNAIGAELYRREIAAAPSCVVNSHAYVSSEMRQKWNLAPDTPIVEVIATADLVLGSLSRDPACAQAICTWLNKFNPGQVSNYCIAAEKQGLE